MDIQNCINMKTKKSLYDKRGCIKVRFRKKLISDMIQVLSQHFKTI